MGAGSRKTQTAMLPPFQFHCLLDELPWHLIPQGRLRFGGYQNFSDEPLFFNPQCSLLCAGEVPLELERHRHLVKNFYSGGTTAWVRDPATGSLQPFWLGPRLEAAVSQLRPGDPVPESVSRDVRSVLADAGILVHENAVERRTAEWFQVVQKGAQQFQQKGYAPLRSLIHPYHIAALRRYYRHAVRREAIHLGDEQSSRRYVAHNEVVARFFHQQLTSTVSAIVGEPIKPSYVYLASYLSGAELKKHTDRAECEFSVTLCLDFSPEPELATSWPIRLETPKDTVAVYQALGDGLIYRGTKVSHYRAVLPDGHTSTSMFLHYVAADFSGSLE